MRTRIIDERTVATDLLTSGGWALDVGARGYVFAREMARLGLRVVAVDPEPPPAGFAIEGVTVVEAGIVGVGHAGRATFASWDNGEPDCLVGYGGPVPDRARLREVATVDVRQLMGRFDVRQWDVVKMNCEGAEFDVLQTWPGPIAKQIAVSFHDHTGANPGGEETYRALLGHLAKWYDVERHVWEDRYSAGFSFWDSLFVLRGPA